MTDCTCMGWLGMETCTMDTPPPGCWTAKACVVDEGTTYEEEERRGCLLATHHPQDANDHASCTNARKASTWTTQKLHVTCNFQTPIHAHSGGSSGNKAELLAFTPSSFGVPCAPLVKIYSTHKNAQVKGLYKVFTPKSKENARISRVAH